ncbi:MarC family protein [Reichenbachiella sp. MALMAid0571]|uniref:MarC family protein n=1 Tax=Reichenbachiella sp. MALMAid0571 TaxID=3143939 RepID=UPI0032DF0A58
MGSVKEILSVSLILFSVIDIIGNVPIVINLRKKVGHIQSGKATIVAGAIMVLFLFVGETILNLFGIDIGSFAVAGALIMFLIGMEMVLGIELFKSDPDEVTNTASIVPIAFPLIAGPGTMTSLISLRAEFDLYTILIGIAINVVLIYLVLKSSNWLERKLGSAGFNILRKVFGIILLSISIKIFKTQFALG